LIIGILLAVVAAVWLLALRSRPSPVRVTLPTPNGYAELLQAANLVATTPGGEKVSALDSTTETVAELRAALEPHARALELVRLGLTKECRVPVEYTSDYIGNSVPALTGFKRVAQALMAEGRLAELEGRTNEAARSYLACVQLGEASARGGMLIHRLVGMACGTLGVQKLRHLLPTLDGAAQKMVLDGLAKVEAQHEPVQAAIDQDKAWTRAVYGPVKLFPLRLAEAFNRLRGQVSPTDRAVTHSRTAEANIRLLRVDLALRLYRAEHGRFPAQLSALVPGYLDAPPLDPFNGQPLIYRLQGASYLLYSVGPDGKDDGGTLKQRSPSATNGDFVSDAP
jgi:hypothetical protein